MPWTTLCDSADLHVGSGQAFEIDGNEIAVFNVEGEFLAIDDTCTHEEASLAEGFLENHLVECPLHGSQFDLRTGEVLSLPAVFSLKTHPVRVQDGQVQVEISSVEIE